MTMSVPSEKHTHYKESKESIYRQEELRKHKSIKGCRLKWFRTKSSVAGACKILRSSLGVSIKIGVLGGLVRILLIKE